MAADCIFCKIAQGTIPVTLLHSDEHCVAFADKNPQAPVHLLVVPRLHVRDLPELCAHGEGGTVSGHLLRVANQLAQTSPLHEKGFRIVINTGEHGGQSVFHLHLHVLGGRPLGWPPG
jgi:histidine triad (HIT) family protein